MAIFRALPLSIAIPAERSPVALPVHPVARVQPFSRLVLGGPNEAEEGAAAVAAAYCLETVLRETGLGVDECARELSRRGLDHEAQDPALDLRVPSAARRNIRARSNLRTARALYGLARRCASARFPRRGRHPGRTQRRLGRCRVRDGG